ncbi:M15 family metallopeptidase [Kribbella sp.]|uniref:M15 family metallopeptidase n=1 Tax=Kribbella sp. TaxID=1871183 RepID=UPI002D6A6221|nr:M15 family metallopeptidase [Kribbella sp.]HZX02221.1 M15 family metallopeptidase [Kribbella sp.]
MSDRHPDRRAPRTRLLSVIGVVGVGAVAGSLLLWHQQVGDALGLGADKRPVVSTNSAPAYSAPPVTVASVTPTVRRTTKTPRTSPTEKPAKTPIEQPTEQSTEEPTQVPREENIDALSPKLEARLKKAFAAAKAAGVPIRINSGKRSAAKQQRLLNEAIEKYGSYQAATRWVLPPKYSAHVLGKAVDIAPAAAMTWLDKNGWRYGICRRYDNEPWHFEATTTPGTKCPPREPHALAKADND